MPGFPTQTNVVGVNANRRDSYKPGESPAVQSQMRRPQKAASTKARKKDAPTGSGRSTKPNAPASESGRYKFEERVCPTGAGPQKMRKPGRDRMRKSQE
jgi:hypothetical protein